MLELSRKLSFTVIIEYYRLGINIENKLDKREICLTLKVIYNLSESNYKKQLAFVGPVYIFWDKFEKEKRTKKTKRIRDRSIISSIKPKMDDQFFVDLRVLYKL